MNLEINPYVGVGPVRFGMTIQEVRDALAKRPETFRKSPNDAFPTDAFDDLGIHVSYRSPGVCDAVELALAADPTLMGRRLIERPFDELRDWLESLDDGIVVDDTGLTSFKLGLGLYAPSHQERASDSVEAIIVFERGYYDT